MLLASSADGTVAEVTGTGGSALDGDGEQWGRIVRRETPDRCERTDLRMDGERLPSPACSTEQDSDFNQIDSHANRSEGQDARWSPGAVATSDAPFRWRWPIAARSVVINYNSSGETAKAVAAGDHGARWARHCGASRRHEGGRHPAARSTRRAPRSADRSMCWSTMPED